MRTKGNLFTEVRRGRPQAQTIMVRAGGPGLSGTGLGLYQRLFKPVAAGCDW